MATTATTASYPDIYDARFRKIVQNRYDYWMKNAEYKAICNEETDRRAVLKQSAISGFGVMPTKAQGADVEYQIPDQEYDQTLTKIVYGMGFRLTLEAMDDDSEFGAFKKMTVGLSRSAQYAVEVAVANLYNRAFTAGYTGGDSKVLCATDHPLSSGTEQNRLSVLSALSMTSLEQAVIDFESTVDHKGLPLAIKAKTLLIPKELKFMARRLLKSELRPLSADNDINAIQEENLEYTVNHFLTSTTAWFLLADKQDHDVVCLWQIKPTAPEHDTDYDSGDLKFKITQRFATGFFGWRGIFGGNS